VVVVVTNVEAVDGSDEGAVGAVDVDCAVTDTDIEIVGDVAPEEETTVVADIVDNMEDGEVTAVVDTVDGIDVVEGDPVVVVVVTTVEVSVSLGNELWQHLVFVSREIYHQAKLLRKRVVQTFSTSVEEKRVPHRPFFLRRS
jgi:hypothetical protein